MSETNQTEPNARFPWFLCALFSGLALALRLYRLDFQALFLDEYCSWRESSIPGFFEFLRTVWLHEANPPLHFFLLRGWMAVFGDSPASLRMPSVLFGVATVWAMMRVVWDAGMRRRFPLAVVGLLVAVSPYALYYSQEARAYSMLLFLAVLVLLFVVRIWSRPGVPRTRDLVGLSLVGLIAALTHYFALFVLFFGGLSLVAGRLCGVRRGGWRAVWEWRTFLVVVWLAALSIGIVLASVVLADTSHLIAWLPEWSPMTLFYHWIALSEGPLLRCSPIWMPWGALAFWCVALLTAAASLRRCESRPSGGMFLVAVLVILTTWLLPHAVSAFRPILFHGQRYLVIALPAFWFAIAVAASVVRWRWLFSALLVAFMLCRPFWYGEYYFHRHKRAWDEIAAICEAKMKPGDMVWYLAVHGRGALLYYLRDSGLKVSSRKTPFEMPAPSPEVRRLAIAARSPAILRFPAPQGFEAEDAWIVERGRPRAEACVILFRRTDADGK